MNAFCPPARFGDRPRLSNVSATESLSVTSNDGFTNRADLALSSGPALGEVLAAYDFEPDGLQFNSPVTLSVRTDVTALTTISKLEALKQRVTSKTGKGNSAEAAAKVIAYTSTVIATLRTRLLSGSTCS
jgi:hypothetical protein